MSNDLFLFSEWRNAVAFWLIPPAGLLLMASVFVVVNLLVDISYTFLDPRIKY